MPTPTVTRISAVPILAAALFVISGALGLGYQLVWIRKASLLVGSSQVALATVVASFFLGLALGSAFVGRRLRSRSRSPLFVYGLFEIGIGVFALALPSLLEGVGAVYAAAYPLFEGSAPGLFALRFALFFLLFLPPTFLMGGTLPLLLDGLVERDRAIGSQTSLLYGLNILGAVAGVLLTAYLAIPRLGMDATSVAGGAGNLAIGALALAAFRRRPPLHASSASDEPRARTAPVFVALAFASGFAAIAWQIAWARYFGLFQIASVYRTALLLAVFLLALATGSLLLAALLRRGANPLRLLAFAQPLAVILVFVCLDAWQLGVLRFTISGPQTTLEMVPDWSLVSETVDADFLSPFFQVGLSIFLPVTLLGMGLPALIAGAAHHTRELRATAGSLVFWNTLGSSAGAFAAGYLLIPLLGLSETMVAISLVSIGVGVGAGWLADPGRLAPGTSPLSPAGRVQRAGGVVRIAGVALAGIAFVVARTLTLEDVTLHAIRNHQGQKRLGPGKGGDVVAVLEGPLNTAYVIRDGATRTIGSGNVQLGVVEEGYPSEQAIQGHLPVLFYPRPGTPKRALGIALGTGQSFGALLMHPIEHLDIVDISSAMLRLSLEHFDEVNHGLARDPRVSFHLDDGRHFVERAPDASYDLVSMEPPPPTAEGVYALYSLEFYQSVRRVLRDGGVLMQWLPHYFLPPDVLLGLIRTQAEAFPQTFVIRSGRFDPVAISFDQAEPPQWSTAWIEQRARIFAGERELHGARWTPRSRHGIASLDGVLALILTGPEDVARIEAPWLYRDDDQLLSYHAHLQMLRRYSGGTVSAFSSGALPLTPFRELAKYFQEPIPEAQLDELDEERARSSPPMLNHTLPSQLARDLASFEGAQQPELRARAALVLAGRYDLMRRKRDALGWVERAIRAAPGLDVREDLAAGRRIARYAIAVECGTLRSWLAALPAELGTSPLAREMRDVLHKHELREETRRAGYLCEPADASAAP